MPRISRQQRVIDILWERDKGICGICEKPIRDRACANVDHIVPKSKRGSDALENKQLAHKLCNSAKGNLMPNAPVVVPPKTGWSRRRRKIIWGGGR